MITAILFTVLFAVCGIAVSEVVFRKHSFINRIWLGLSLGLLLLTWLPSLFAFLIGFTKTAQFLSAAVASLIFCACVAIWTIRRKHKIKNDYSVRSLPIMLIVSIPILAIGAVLFNTHILYPHEDGSLWVGQVTYGDLAMHLGFLTSIVEQAAFPPQYSIFPGHALNYPFLCETSGASLYLLGASTRQAYIISAFYAFSLVAFGVYRFFRQWLKKGGRTALATVLFFLGGGFGFFYFFDLAKQGGLLQYLIGTDGQTVSQTLLDGFYHTPTNIPALGLRWVNPIVDMLIPQRATLFGWAILFPCLYLLHGFAFEKKRGNLIMLGVFAGALPLIHTHSFLALGIISAYYCVSDLISNRFEKNRVLQWLLYALIACALAAPQLFGFSFRQASESSLVRFHLNWGNTTDSYLWFYIKNLGFIFLLIPIAFLLLSKRDRKIYLGVCFVWLIAEFVEFQPNDYDNNKLLFIWYAYTCGLVAKLLCSIAHRIQHRFLRNRCLPDIIRSNQIGIVVLSACFAIYFLIKLVLTRSGEIVIPVGTAFTLFLICGFLFVLTIRTALFRQNISAYALYLISCIFSVFWMISTGCIWYRQYTSADLHFMKWLCLIGFALSALGALIPIIKHLTYHTVEKKRFCGGSLAMTLAAYILIFAMTVSSAMTILREIKSEYQVYTRDEVVLAEQIKNNTESDAVILANSYHWNLITPLTGRSIVTGTSTFLYYHGIDNSQRERDVIEMYEQPESNLELFQTYNVCYILVSNAERYHYNIDYEFLEAKCEIVAQNAAGTLYKLR